MTREHICFIQAQRLSWASEEVAGRTGVSRKVLSLDSETGASTAIMRYPPGWAMQIEHCLDSSEEILVLQGELNINGQTLGHHGYSYMPAGAPRTSMCASDGAVVLTMFSAEPRYCAIDAVNYDDSQLIPHIDVYTLPWLGGMEGSVTGKPLSNGLATKLLRRDADTGEQSFLYSAYAHHPPPEIMVGKFGHPMVEELFVLAGEFAFADVGLMKPGGYCWWREGQYHGPVGSQMGYLMFIRNLGGPLQNDFPQNPYPFSYRPEHRPDLPEHLASAAAGIADMKCW